MKIYPIETGNFKLDGGAMFGVVPKSIWSKTNPADNNNMVNWAMRCMLIEDGDRLILIDTGIGDKQSEKFFSYYYLFGNETLKSSIEKLGFGLDEITDVFLTHLHFDHVGGAVQWSDSGRSSLEIVFKNATFWSNENHWQWAIEPNAREKASFLSENMMPLKENGQLKFIDRINDYQTQVLGNMDAIFVDGHTESQMLPRIKYQGKTIVFVADLMPAVAHIPLPYVIGYDTRPLQTLKEKEKFLNLAANEDYILFFEHDYNNECCTVQHTEKGVRVKDTFKFSEMFN